MTVAYNQAYRFIVQKDWQLLREMVLAEFAKLLAVSWPSAQYTRNVDCSRQWSRNLPAEMRSPFYLGTEDISEVLVNVSDLIREEIIVYQTERLIYL